MRRSTALAAVALVLLGCGAIVLSRSFLFGEASELLVIVLERGVAYRIEQALVGTRPAMWLPILPVILARRVSDDLGTLALVFGAAHAVVPVLSLAAVLRLLRRERIEASMVAAIGVCLAGLPGQVFVVSGHLAGAQLYWVLLACVFRADSGSGARWAAPPLVVLLFFLHPSMAALFLGTGALLVLGSPRHRRVGWAFLATGLVRAAAIALSSGRVRLTDPTHPSIVKLQAAVAQEGAALLALYFALVVVAAGVLLWRGRRRAVLSGACVLAAAAALAAFHAGNPRALKGGVWTIGWIFAVSIPVHAVFLRLLEPRRRDAAPADAPPFAALASLVTPVVFVVGVLLASRQFVDQLAEARRLVARAPAACVERRGVFEGVPSSLDDSFGYFEYVYLATGGARRVGRVVLDDGRCARLCAARGETPGAFFYFVPATRAGGAPDACSLRDLLE